MPVLKRYQLTKLKGLSTNFDVNGNLVQVSFKGGVNKPFFMPGRFHTANPELQQAIEASAGFNVDYRLEFSEGEPEVVAEVPQPEAPVEPEQAPEPVTESEQPEPETPAEVPQPEAPETPEPKADEPAQMPEELNVVDYPEVTSVTQAKQKLIDLFEDVKISTLKNKNDVLAKATEKNVTFSNLK